MVSEREQHRAYLRYLSHGANDQTDPIAHLASVCAEGADNAIQIAAIQGLLHHRQNPRVLLVLAKRLLDPQRLAVRRYLVQNLERLKRDGGLVLLALAFTRDDRLIIENVAALDRLVHAGAVVSPSWPKPGAWERLELTEGGWTTMAFLLRTVEHEDFRAGLLVGMTVGQGTEGSGGIAGGEPPQQSAKVPFRADEAQQAIDLVERRVPGLVGLLRAHAPS